MGSNERRRWKAEYVGQSRLDRQGCDYDAFVPDPLDGWDLAIPADVGADVSDAEAAVARLNVALSTAPNLDGVARFLLRAEAVASSQIEGLRPGPRRLLAAEVAISRGGTVADRAALEVLDNIAAMEGAIAVATTPDRRLTEADLRAIHQQLMASSPYPVLGGVVRRTQNWIGGSHYNPCSAAFVPPPPEYLPDLLDDLVDYVNSDSHSPLVQAAIAHAQFETIHPFADGNGRTGRALIHVILRRRGLAPRFVPPISLVLATSVGDYITGLSAFRHLGPALGSARSASAVALLRTFAMATTRACSDAAWYEARIAELAGGWRDRLGRVRAGSAVDLLIGILAGAPVLTVDSAARIIGRSAVQTGQAVNRLMEVGILRRRSLTKQRYRVFEAGEVIELFTDLDRALNSAG